MKFNRLSIPVFLAACAWMLVSVPWLAAQQPRRPQTQPQEEPLSEEPLAETQPINEEGFAEEPQEPPARTGAPAGEGATYPGEPGGPTDDFQPQQSLYDPPFARYVDMDMLVQAWHGLDAGLLTDAALQVVEGERILYRPHKAISGDALLMLAVRVASEQRDQDTLSRLARIAEGTGNEQLHALVASAGKLAGQSRGDDEGLMLSADSTTAEQLTLIKQTLHGMRVASILGDAEHFAKLGRNLENAEGSLAVLSFAQKEGLKKIMDLRKESIVTDTETTAALSKLAGNTRAGGGRAANVIGSVFRGVGTILGGADQGVYVGGQNGYYYEAAPPVDDHGDHGHDHDHADDHDHGHDDVDSGAGNTFMGGGGRINRGRNGGIIDTRPRTQPITLSRLLGSWYDETTARDGSLVLNRYVLYRNGSYDMWRFEQDPRSGDWDLDHPIAHLADSARLSQRQWTSDGQLISLARGQRFAEGPYRMSYSVSGSTGYSYLSLASNGRSPRKWRRGPDSGP